MVRPRGGCLVFELAAIQGEGDNVAEAEGTGLVWRTIPSWPQLTLIPSQRPYLQIPLPWGFGLPTDPPSMNFGGHSS